MKKQRSQVIALVLLLIFWAVLWRFFIRKPPPPASEKPVTAKVIQAENPLRARFHKLRSEMDALYHYRINPAPFDARWNPFRIPGVADASPPGATASKIPATDASQLSISSADFAESLLKSAIAAVRVGGVFNMNGTIQLTVDAQLHREGDVFTVRVPTPKGDFRPVRIRVKHLSEASVTFALEDTDTGGAELRVRLK
jgi:hypothetical protein